MARQRKRLSDLAVRRSKKLGYYADGRQLYLQVSPSGSKSWLLRFARHGRERWMGLGPYPDVSLAEARQKAFEARRLLFDGVDPIEARRLTFKDCADRYIAAHEAGWRNAKHRAQWRSTLENLTATAQCRQRRRHRHLRCDRSDLHGGFAPSGAGKHSRPFVEKLLAPARTARMGLPMDSNTQVGRVTTRPQCEKVLSYIDIARRGGRARQRRALWPHRGVWTSDIGRALNMATRIRAGTVWVNAYRVVSYMSPFGGYKRSGLGRENGQEMIKEYL